MKTRPSGVTLIEVLVSLAVLAFGLTAAANTVVYASRFLATGTHVQDASMLAQSLLTTLMALPYDSRGTGPSASPNTLFTNTSTTNDTDVADSAKAFTAATLAAGVYDHADGELAGAARAMVAPIPAGNTTYERYWNIAPVGTNGVVIAVIVRWRESGTWRRTVVIGTRYSP
jgi:prepilin-type N-terminal cleavage/methylation domain-containing protein